MILKVSAMLLEVREKIICWGRERVRGKEVGRIGG